MQDGNVAILTLHTRFPDSESGNPFRSGRLVFYGKQFANSIQKWSATER